MRSSSLINDRRRKRQRSSGFRKLRCRRRPNSRRNMTPRHNRKSQFPARSPSRSFWAAIKCQTAVVLSLIDKQLQHILGTFLMHAYTHALTRTEKIIRSINGRSGRRQRRCQQLRWRKRHTATATAKAKAHTTATAQAGAGKAAGRLIASSSLTTPLSAAAWIYEFHMSDGWPAMWLLL